GDERLDLIDGLDVVQLDPERFGSEADAGGVRILVGPDEEVVGIARALPAEEVVRGPEVRSELERGGGLFVRALRRNGDADSPLPGQRLEELDRAIDRDARPDRGGRVALAGARPLDALVIGGVVGDA